MAFSAASFRPRAFKSTTLNTFTGSVGTAVIETGEGEFNEGGRAYIDSVKPHVESTGTAPTVTVRVGYRDSLSAAVTYTSALTPLARTGVANMRVDAKYMRIEVTIVGNFSKAIGVEFRAEPSGFA